MRYTFEQFAAVRSYGSLTFSPDGQWVAYTTTATGQFNVWKQPVVPGPNGPQMPIQLTALTDDATRQVFWSPDGSRLLTTADHHGTENFQLYDIPAGEGWLYPLTDLPAVRHELEGSPFSPDGKRIAYASNERNPADFDIFVRDLDQGEGRAIVTDGAYFNAINWSPDGRALLVLRLNSNTDQDLYVVDVASGEKRHLTPHEGETKFFPGPWRPDGGGIYLLTDRDREYLGLAFYDLASGELSWVETPDWDVQDVDISRDGRFLAWLVNEDGWSRLHLRDLTTGEQKTFPGLPSGVYSAMRFSPDGSRLGLIVNRPVRPATVCVVEIATGAVQRLTQSFLGGVPEAAMVEPELIRYRSADGREIPAFLYRPHGLADGARAPVVLSVHGGPESQELPTYAYSGLYQYLLSRGIGILATNIRGSTGYGKTYQKLIHRDWGGAELRDLEHAALYLRSLPWVAPDRLGVFGASFGGFATLSCVARLPEYWAAAVDIVGPSNLLTFVKAVPPAWRRMMKQWVGDPDEDVEMLRERSPITYVEQVRAPLLVIQGANDPRVVKPESDQMVERLRELGRTVEYMVFEDEGHGFTKTANSLKALKATAEWLEKHLTK
jgi:dipeptidyl aminopeptidase/acylaminoacyl peptidase